MKQNLIIALLVVVVGLLAWPHYQKYQAAQAAEELASRQEMERLHNAGVFGLGEEK